MLCKCKVMEGLNYCKIQIADTMVKRFMCFQEDSDGFKPAGDQSEAKII